MHQVDWETFESCEHTHCRVDATSVLVADGGSRHGKRHLNIRARCEDCRRLFSFGDVLGKSDDGTKVDLAMTAGKLDPTPQCNSCGKDLPGVASNFPVDCAACIAEARAIEPSGHGPLGAIIPPRGPLRPMLLPPPPAKTLGELVGPRGTIRPVGTARKVHPGAAIYGFMGWLTTRDERSGPFSSTDDAASAAELAGAYVDAQGWRGDKMSMYDLVPGPSFTIHRCGSKGECVGCCDCERIGT